MIRDFFFVLRAMIYAIVIALILQVQWQGRSLESMAMAWVNESSVADSIRNTAQKVADKLNGAYTETSSQVDWEATVESIPTSRARQLIQLKRSPAVLEAQVEKQTNEVIQGEE